MAMNKSVIAIAVVVAGVVVAAARAQQSGGKPSLIEQHIATFDDLDFNVFTHQKWNELKKSHSRDVIVHWPDGHQTMGIEKHIEDLKALFVYAPDTRILVHPIKFGSGEWTSVIGVMEGTFTAPMPVANGKPLSPTGKAFKLTMNTVGRWNAQGTMDEEYLFWDNQTYMQQIGLGK
jgi:SnoaL-like polyketide cyclase